MIYEKMILKPFDEEEEWQPVTLPQLKVLLSQFYPKTSADVLWMMEDSARANAPRPGSVLSADTFYRAKVEEAIDGFADLH